MPTTWVPHPKPRPLRFRVGVHSIRSGFLHARLFAGKEAAT
jgi:hypothetical protein